MNTLIDSIRLTLLGRSVWPAIAEAKPSVANVLFWQTIPLALIPGVCWYFGVTQFGWSVAGDPVRLTTESALPMCMLFVLACVLGVLFLGYMVHWMSGTYGDQATLRQGVTLISFTATPFFLAGVIGLYPILWLDILVGLGVACYCIYLLYTGVGPVMDVISERGFLYASAVFAVALVAFVGLLCATVLLWEFGPSPEYRY